MNASPFAYKLHLFGRFCASPRVNKIRRNVFSLLDAVNQSLFWVQGLNVKCKGRQNLTYTSSTTVQAFDSRFIC